MRRVLVCNDDYKVVADLDPEVTCKESPPCGGCDECLMKQAAYAGYGLYTVVSVPPEAMWNENAQSHEVLQLPPVPAGPQQ